MVVGEPPRPLPYTDHDRIPQRRKFTTELLDRPLGRAFLMFLASRWSGPMGGPRVAMLR